MFAISVPTDPTQYLQPAAVVYIGLFVALFYTVPIVVILARGRELLGLMRRKGVYIAHMRALAAFFYTWAFSFPILFVLVGVNPAKEAVGGNHLMQVWAMIGVGIGAMISGLLIWWIDDQTRD